MTLNCSLVIPIFNSSAALKKNTDALNLFLKDSIHNWEVIIVDDGSQAPLEIQNIANQFGFHYIRLAKNLGKGAAIKAGFQKASGDFHFFTDSDIPLELNQIDELVKSMHEGVCDFVVGNRNLEDSDYYGKTPFLRKVFSHLFNFIVQLLFSENCDSQCGLKGFKKEVSQHIFQLITINRFAFDVEIIIIAKIHGYKYLDFPANLRSKDGKSVNLFADGLSMMKDLVFIKIRQLRNTYTN